MITAGALTLPPIPAARDALPPTYNTSDWGTQAWAEDVESAEATAIGWVNRTADARGWSDSWRGAGLFFIRTARAGVPPSTAENILTRGGSWLLGFGLLALWYETATRAPAARTEQFFGDLARLWYVADTLGDEDSPPGWSDLGKVWAMARESTRVVARGRRQGDIGVIAYETLRETTQDVQDKAIPTLIGVTVVVAAGFAAHELSR